MWPIQFTLALASLTLFLQCSVNEFDISGHWHLVSCDETGRNPEEELIYTLDVFDHQSAYFNLPDLASADRDEYEAATKNTDSLRLEQNLDTLAHTLRPLTFLRQQGIDHIEYFYNLNDQLHFIFYQDGTVKGHYLASRVADCYKSDYCYFNPQVPLWCNMNLELTEHPLDSNLFRGVSKYTFDLYLGLSSDSETPVLMMNADAKTDIDFPDLEQVIAANRQTLPPKSRARIQYNLHIDRRVPYQAVDYLKWQLRKSGQLAVNYIVAGGQVFLTRLPPFSADSCDPPFNQPRKCLSDPVLTAEGQQYLQQLGLTADWNPTIKYADFQLKPENVFLVKVQADGQVSGKGQLMSFDELFVAGKDFIWLADVPATKVFLLEGAPNAPFGAYLNALITLKEAYAWVYDQASQQQFQAGYRSLPVHAQKSIRNQYPYIVSTTGLR